MEFTQKEYLSNQEWIIKLMLGDVYSSELWSDRVMCGTISDDKLTQWGDSKHTDIYMLIDKNGNPFYVGKANDVSRRILSHRSVVSTNDYTQKDFTYKIIDSAFAPDIFAAKLEFMYIVNCILLHGIDNVHYRKHAKWCFYYQEDIKLFHESVSMRKTFQEYQHVSLLVHVDRDRSLSQLIE